jgi:hypothetical protein
MDEGALDNIFLLGTHFSGRYSVGWHQHSNWNESVASLFDESFINFTFTER